eukprot:jgi/Mesvir1/26943/Mv20664-RA.1
MATCLATPFPQGFAVLNNQPVRKNALVGQPHSVEEKLRLSKCAGSAFPAKRVHAVTAEQQRPESQRPREDGMDRRAFLSAAVSFAGSAWAGAAFGAAAPVDNSDILYEENLRIQRLNGAPDNFPAFIRQGFNVTVLTPPGYTTTPTGLMYYDFEVGTGEEPQDGQEVVFDYIAYNENGKRIDSTYNKGQPAQTRLGISGMIPGFEEGLRGMRVNGKRRIIVPPELGPPVSSPALLYQRHAVVGFFRRAACAWQETAVVPGFISLSKIELGRG